jgi:hypothetical protein
MARLPVKQVMRSEVKDEVAFTVQSDDGKDDGIDNRLANGCECKPIEPTLDAADRLAAEVNVGNPIRFKFNGDESIDGSDVLPCRLGKMAAVECAVDRVEAEVEVSGCDAFE